MRRFSFSLFHILGGGEEVKNSKVLESAGLGKFDEGFEAGEEMYDIGFAS
jgi:hypothetical protein